MINAEEWDEPDDFDDRDDDPCDHDDRDIDILTGRWSCYRCGEAGWASNEQIDAEIKHQAAYAEWEDRENRRQWWRNLLAPMLYPLSALHWQWHLLKHRWRKADDFDDEIPF